MTERARKYLFDIQDAIDRIGRFVQLTPTLAEYEAHELVRNAVERQLAVIGEAVNHYRREPGATELVDARRIIELRNRLIHAYDSIQHPVIWAILRRNLPALRAEVTALLAAE